MYSPVSLLAICILYYTTQGLVLPASSDLARPVSLISSNQTTTSNLATIRLQNTTHNPVNFLGVHCYHLLPDTVDLEMCQPLFAWLLHDFDAYKEKRYWNGWRFQRGSNPCTIALSSPDRKDSHVRMSMAAIVMYATEVLQTCRETSTGGANVFDGNWRVAITKYAL